MILKEKQSRKADSTSSSTKMGRLTSLISRVSLWKKLKTSKDARDKFVESNLDRTIAYQIRALRERESWTQKQLAEKLGIEHANNVSARLENPHYGSHSLTTLKKVAAAFDVALVVWFVPFSRFVDWTTSTPQVDTGLTPGFYEIPPFEKDHLQNYEIPAEPAQVFRGAGTYRFEPELPDEEALGNAPMPLEEEGLGAVKKPMQIEQQQQPMEMPNAG